MAISTEREFNRWSIAAFDLEAAIRFGNAAQGHPANSVEYEALLFSALVCYARPFSGNERGSDAAASSRLNLDALAKLSASEKRMHEKCTTLRNRALAHSEVAMNPTRLRVSGVVMSKPFSLLTPPFDLPGFLGLAEKLRFACERRRADYVCGRRRNRRIDSKGAALPGAAPAGTIIGRRG